MNRNDSPAVEAGKGMGLRGKLISGFAFLSLIILATGGAGLYSVNDIKRSVEVFSDVTTPIQTASSHVVHNVEKMRNEMLGALNERRLERINTAEQALESLGGEVDEALGKIATIAADGNLALDVTRATELEEDFHAQSEALMAALRRERDRTTQAEQTVAEFDTRIAQISDTLSVIAKTAESEMGEQEDGSRTLIQGGKATFDELTTILDDVFNKSYLRLQGAYTLINYSVKLGETARIAGRQNDGAAIDAMEKLFGKYLKASQNRLRRLAARARGTDFEKTLAELADHYDKIEAMALGEDGLFSVYRDSLAATQDANAAVAALETASSQMLVELDAVAGIAEARNGDARDASATAVANSVTGLGVAVLAGMSFAFVFGIVFVRSISSPLLRMRESMARLAEGNTDIEIPGLNRTDEIGAMALAVEVFKSNAIDKVRLEEGAGRCPAARRGGKTRKRRGNWPTASSGRSRRSWTACPRRRPRCRRPRSR